MSRFAELKKYETVDEWDTEDPRNAVDQVIEPPVSPSSEGYEAYVYIDQDRYGDTKSIDKILAHCKNVLLRRKLHNRLFPKLITRASLKHHRFIAFPKAEKKFIKVGYVCEIEAREVTPGQRIDSIFNAAHKCAVHAQALVMEEIVRTLGPTFFGWSPEVVGDELRKALAPLFGRGANRSYVLVERNGILLGTEHADHLDVIHAAFAGTPDSWIRQGRSAIGLGYFGERGPRDVRSQVQFELQQRVCEAIFGARHWPSRARDRRDLTVSPEMVMVWYSQWLAALKKVTWRVGLEEAPGTLTNILSLEQQATGAKPVGFGGRLPKRDPAKDEHSLIRTELEKTLDYIGGINGRKAAVEQIKVNLSSLDLVIGQLSGMTFDDRAADEPPAPLYMVSSWLGEMRLKGHVVLNGEFWDELCYAEYESDDESWDLLQFMLPDEIWRFLKNAAVEISRTDRKIDVIYEWTRNEQQPWAVKRTRNRLWIRGPLLHFPTYQIQRWADAAGMVKKQRGFQAPLTEPQKELNTA